MKRVSHLTALTAALGLASFSTLAADMAHSLTLTKLQQQQGSIIDTRASAFYNGCPQTLPATSLPPLIFPPAGWER